MPMQRISPPPLDIAHCVPTVIGDENLYHGQDDQKKTCHPHDTHLGDDCMTTINFNKVMDTAYGSLVE